MDIEEFRRRGKEAVDIIADYYQNVDALPPKPSVEPGYLYNLIPHAMPEAPESFDSIIHDMNTKITPGMMHWQSGNFFGWFPSCSSFPSIIGEMFNSMYSVIGFNWVCSPAATELEIVVMDWLGKLVGLDSRFLSPSPENPEGRGGGVIQGSASEAMVVAMIAAREMALDHLRSQGVPECEINMRKHKLIAYASDQTHSAAEKASKIIGVEVHIVPTNDEFQLTKHALRQQIDEDKQRGLRPFFVCGTFGTTNTTAIDELPGLATVAEAENMWLHIDAAYAGSALACPEFRPLARGIERAHSFNFNLNKWMLTNFDCSALWVADSTHLVNALCIHREYLPRDEGIYYARNMRDWQLPLSRRFRALKVWFVLRMYGASGIRAHIRDQVSLARWLETQLIADGRFEIVAPVVFGLVVFRLSPRVLPSSSVEDDCQINQANEELHNYIVGSGRVFLVSTLIKNKCALRAAVGSVFATQKNVELLVNVIRESATAVMSRFA
ncbi:hypothetical protein GGF43_001295 [Coemansia sp. RSA 2618]|nr:hypothetical protein GGF43_001295 [Coemansia sp. RSA 2618]